MARHFVFGAVGGIGEAIARRLSAGGYEVLLGGRDAAALERLAGEIGGVPVVGDVLDEATFAKAAEAAGERLDGLVYAVGTINLKPFERLSEDDYINDFRINALGAAKAVQALLPALRAAPKGASVVLFSTVAVEQGFPAHASIAMAKGAVAALVRSLAAELAPQIRINALAPSLTETPLGARVAASPKMADAIAKMHPLPRLGRAEDMAALASLLLGPEGSWITGQVIGVDGGRSTLRTKG